MVCIRYCMNKISKIGIVSILLLVKLKL